MFRRGFLMVSGLSLTLLEDIVKLSPVRIAVFGMFPRVHRRLSCRSDRTFNLCLLTGRFSSLVVSFTAS
jgi:hypothetical protein